jgi:hypothetical protein
VSNFQRPPTPPHKTVVMRLFVPGVECAEDYQLPPRGRRVSLLHHGHHVAWGHVEDARIVDGRLELDLQAPEFWRRLHDGDGGTSLAPDDLLPEPDRPVGPPEAERDPLARIADALERLATAAEVAVAGRRATPDEDLPDPLRVKYDAAGVNQWGVKHHGRCQLCDSDFPSNALGDGTCRQCGAITNTRAGTVTVGSGPITGPSPRVRPEEDPDAPPSAPAA